tara:strand:- start:43 stop:240 length:198 start_codon:yes stop_codon:yes gene_type:complete
VKKFSEIVVIMKVGDPCLDQRQTILKSFEIAFGEKTNRKREKSLGKSLSRLQQPNRGTSNASEKG